MFFLECDIIKLMNKFLAVVALAALLYSPQVYAGDVAKGVNNIFDVAAAFAVDLTVAVVDVTQAVNNFAIDIVVGGLGFVGLDPLADWFDNTGRMIVDGAATFVKGTVVTAASGAMAVWDNLWSNPNNFGEILGSYNCDLWEYDLTRRVDKCPEEPGVTSSSITSSSITPSVPLGAFTTTAFANALSTCTGITLSGINAQGHNYAIVRDGAIIKELSASETGYTDTGLTPHTNYSYAIRIPYPAESGYETTDSAPIAAYTRCLPSCGFGVTSSSVAKYGAVELRWKCDYNDPTVDTGACKITDSLGTLSKAIDAKSGSMKIKVNENNQYALQCANVDGAISIPQSVKVLELGIKEVKP